MIKFGILAGVSTDLQAAEERESIPDQISTCRRAIAQLGGLEVSLYTIDGYSRTGYDSLAEAMRDIPALSSAIEDAGAGRYDVLIMDNFDRLGDLGQLVHTRFKRYRRQLYSARQSGRVHDPDNYDPYTDESAGIDIHIQGILQNYRLNKLQRGLRLGVRRRVEEGRYSRSYPRTYKKDRYTGELVRNEPLASLMVQLKDAYLGGAVLRELVTIASASGIPAPKGGEWHRSIIQRLLLNPFNAGKVFDGRFICTPAKISPLTGRRIYKVKQKEAELLDGRQPALWTYAEYLRIKQESHERHKMVPKSRAWNFSALLICPICGRRAEGRRGRYECHPIHAGCIRLKVEIANEEIGLALASALRRYTESPGPAPVSIANTTAEAAAAIERQVERVQKGYEAELYTALEAKNKIDLLRAQLAGVARGRETAETEAARHKRMIELREQLLPELDLIPEMLEKRESAVNNRFLRDILSGIIIEQDGYKFQWR